MRLARRLTPLTVLHKTLSFEILPAVLTGNNLRIIRAMVNMTQADLAAKAGCSATAITEYENGKRELRSDTVRKLCDALGVRITYSLLGAEITGP